MRSRGDGETPRASRAARCTGPGSGSWPTEVRAGRRRRSSRLVHELERRASGPRSPGPRRAGGPGGRGGPATRLPLPGCGRRRRHGLGPRQRAAEGPDHRAAGRDRKPGRPHTFGLQRNPAWLARTIAAGPTSPARPRPGGRPAVPPDGRLRLRRRRRHPAPSLPPVAPRGASGPRTGWPTSSRSSDRASTIASRRSRVGSPTRARGESERDDGLRLQPAPLCPRAAVRSPRPRRTTACSTWSSSATPGRSRPSITSGWSLRGTHLDDPGVFHRRVRRVRRDRRVEPVPVQLDGDPAGFLPAAAAPGAGRDRGARSPAADCVDRGASPAPSMSWCRRPPLRCQGSARQDSALALESRRLRIAIGSSPVPREQRPEWPSRRMSSGRRKGVRHGHSFPTPSRSAGPDRQGSARWP